MAQSEYDPDDKYLRPHEEIFQNLQPVNNRYILNSSHESQFLLPSKIHHQYRSLQIHSQSIQPVLPCMRQKEAS